MAAYSCSIRVEILRFCSMPVKRQLTIPPFYLGKISRSGSGKRQRSGATLTMLRALWLNSLNPFATNTPAKPRGRRMRQRHISGA